MKLGPVTYTAHRNFSNCPRKFWHVNIAKDLPKEDSTAMRWGNEVHSALDNRIRNGKPLPEAMQKYEHFCSFGRHFVKTELKLGIRESGLPCGFFDSDVWLRGVVDVLIPAWGDFDRAVIWDWKTGKKREDAGELEIHGVLVQAKHPEFKRIMGYYVWLQEMRLGKAHDVSETEKTLERERATRAQIEYAFKHGYEAFAPRQNPLCGWCPVKSCEFNRSAA